MKTRTLTIAQVCFLMGAIVACVGDDPSSTPDADGGTGSSSGNSGGSSGGSSGASSSGGSSGSGDTDAGPDSSLAPDAAPPLGCPVGCLPPAPAGWKGPSAVFDDTPDKKPADCPTIYTQKEVESGHEVSAPAATCACAAGTVNGAKCTATARVYTSSSPTCDSKFGFKSIAVESTTCSGVLGASTEVVVLTPAFVQGSCKYETPTPVKVEATFAKHTLACSIPQAVACQTKTECVTTPTPDAAFGRMCIHKEADELCPSADYPIRIITHKSIDDQRGCAATCAGVATGGTCGTSWGFSATAAAAQCLGGLAPPTTYTAPSSCAPGPAATSVINPLGMAPSGMSCTKSADTAPTGSAKGAEPVTFCCNK